MVGCHYNMEYFSMNVITWNINVSCYNNECLQYNDCFYYTTECYNRRHVITRNIQG